jgi:hypothetical protein
VSGLLRGEKVSVSLIHPVLGKSKLFTLWFHADQHIIGTYIGVLQKLKRQWLFVKC